MHRRDLFRAGAGLMALLALPAAGCAASIGGQAGTAGSSSSGLIATTGVLKADVARAASATATQGRLLAVAAALYKAALTHPGNALISPYSIINALGMTAAGARGTTASALATLLGGDPSDVAGVLTAGDSAMAAAVQASAQSRDGSSLDPAVVDSANSLYVQRGLAVQQAFLDALAQGYGAGVRVSDFAADPNVARAAINAWVAERTRDLIDQLLPAGSINASTLLVLVNALYFKASWASSFAVRPGQASFASPSGTVKVTNMGRTDTLRYAKGTSWHAVSVPFAGNGLAMTVVLPDAGAFDGVSSALDGGTLLAAVSGVPTLVSVTMPKFSSLTGISLKQALTSLGLAPLFDPGQVDLTGIAGQRGDLVVGDVIHQARIIVDENGTEAAAATAVTMTAGAAPNEKPPTPVDFTVDRPFLYLIHDTATATPLFLGRVTDPSR